MHLESSQDGFLTQAWRADSHQAAPSTPASKDKYERSGSQHQTHLSAFSKGNSRFDSDSDLLEILGLGAPGPEQAVSDTGFSERIPPAYSYNARPNDDISKVLERLMRPSPFTRQPEEDPGAPVATQVVAKKFVIPALPVEKGYIVPLLPIAGNTHNDAILPSAATQGSTKEAPQSFQLGERSSNDARAFRDFREPGTFQILPEYDKFVGDSHSLLSFLQII